MVFFTSILIVTILYYLQTDGLIYITVIALAAELINIFLTHTVAKSVEKKLTNRHKRSVQGYIMRIKTLKKTIRELEGIRDEAGTKLYKANARINELEALIKEAGGEEAPPDRPPEPETKAQKAVPEKAPPKQPDIRPDPKNHLPAGSNRKRPPV